MKVLLGFDPGGKRKFGWAVCIDKDDGLNVLATGTADNAKGAMEKSLRAIPEQGSVVAAGIDAPLFWVYDGAREVDCRIRAAIRRVGAKSPEGTVQHFNSLQGACVIQGVLVLKLLRRSFPTLPITEAHPKALLWLMGIARKNYDPNLVKIVDIKEVNIKEREINSEDERDAILGAFTAQMIIKKKSGWKNLLKYERDPVLAGEPPIAYWMPMIK